jgi:hypothetical protein
MSIEVLDKPLVRYSESGETKRYVHAVELSPDKPRVEGDEVTYERTFAQVTETREHRVYTYGPPNQEVIIVSGTVDAYGDYERAKYYTKVIGRRALNGFLALPFAEARLRFANRRALKAVINSEPMKLAKQESQKARIPTAQKVAIS